MTPAAIHLAARPARPPRPALRLALPVLAAFGLAGCVQTAALPYDRSPPRSAAAVPASPYAGLGGGAAPSAATPQVQAAIPRGPTGPLDTRTGLHQSALVAISGSADRRFTVLFRPDRTDAARIEAAPAQLCAQSGRKLASSRTNSPKSGSAMPGVQTMIVECGAA